MPNHNYIEYTFTIHPAQPGAEILMAELGEKGFESFVEVENGLTAYIQKKENWNEGILNDVAILDNPDFEITFQYNEIEQENWNAKWEQNFEPIIVGNQCRVRAPFHEELDFEYDIVIAPKMSFGTGHHETTSMMLQHILDNDFKGKSVLDMGSGTGILAILAKMRGADKVDAIDIDHWCYFNALENVERNNCADISVLEGDSNLLGDKKYDIILANINRNILLQDIPVYSDCLHAGGLLFLSGFYSNDMPMIKEKCARSELVFQTNYQDGDWMATKFLRG